MCNHLYISFAFQQKHHFYFRINSRGKRMNLENLIGQVMISAVDKSFKIVDVEEGDNVEEIIIRANNKKVYNLYSAFTANLIKFNNKDLNKEFIHYIKVSQSYKE